MARMHIYMDLVTNCTEDKQFTITLRTHGGGLNMRNVTVHTKTCIDMAEGSMPIHNAVLMPGDHNHEKQVTSMPVKRILSHKAPDMLHIPLESSLP